MRRLEEELRSLLKREEPAEGFAERVLERVRDERRRARAPLPFHTSSRRWRPLWAAAGVMLCALLGVAYAGYRARKVQRGEMAKAQAIEALRFASTELNVAFQKALVNGPTHRSPRD
jgi:hypothetical protein